MTDTVNKYRVYCQTDSKHEFVWAETEPSTCPTDPVGHTIDAGQTAIVESMGADGPLTEEGVPVMAPTFEHAQGDDPDWDEELYVPVASDGATPLLSVFDKPVTTERFIRGGHYRLFMPLPNSIPFNDTIEFSIVDKDDTLGLFTPMGLTVGVDVLELKKYVHNHHVDASHHARHGFRPGSVFLMVPGLYMRMGYTSTGTEVPSAVAVELETLIIKP